jgi:hypothetical protein
MLQNPSLHKIPKEKLKIENCSNGFNVWKKWPKSDHKYLKIAHDHCLQSKIA